MCLTSANLNTSINATLGLARGDFKSKNLQNALLARPFLTPPAAKPGTPAAPSQGAGPVSFLGGIPQPTTALQTRP